MIRILFSALFLATLPSAQADDLVDSHVSPPEVTSLSDHPKMGVGISPEGVVSIDGIAFSDEQLSVVFCQAILLESEVGLRIRASEKAGFNHVRKVIEIAAQVGLTRVVLTTHGETKTGSQEGRDASAVAADLEELTGPVERAVDEE